LSITGLTAQPVDNATEASQRTRTDWLSKCWNCPLQEDSFLYACCSTYTCLSLGLHPVPYTPNTAFRERMAS